MIGEPPRVTIRLDHPRRHLARRLWRGMATLLGGLLVAIGLAASIGAVPSAIAVLGLLAGWLESEPMDDLPVAGILLAWIALSVLAIGGLRYGLRLVRRHRTLVLFLRRFGDDEAQQAVSFAVLRTIGPSWRIVTLDDEEMVPIGIPPGARGLFRIGEAGSRGLGRIAFTLGVRTFPVLIWAMIGVLALGVAGPAFEHALSGETAPELWLTALDPYLRSLFSVLAGDPPLESIGPTLPGVFALLATAGLVSFAVLIATLVLLLLALPFSTVLLFLSSSAEAVRQGEAAKSLSVKTAGEVQHAAQTIAERSRRVLGPRLVVLRVAAPEWRLAVRELASRASVVLLDVSEPTENVLWELEELILRQRPAVVIGEYSQVAALAGPASDRADRGPLYVRLGALLKGREVLAYTVDRRGLRRFGTALRSVLLERA